MAPPGCHVITLTTLAPARDADFWSAVTESHEERLLAFLDDRYPGIRSAVRAKAIITPTSLERRTGVSGGAMYGWSNIVGQAMTSRLPQRTPVDGLYLAGQWTQPGSGMTPCMQSGYAAAEFCLRRPGTRVA